MASKQHTHKVDKRRNECGNVCLVCKKYRFLKPRAASHEPHPSTITNTCLIAFLQVSSQFLVLEGLKSHILCPSPAFLKTRYSTTEYIGKISSTYNFTTSSIWQKWALSRQMLHYKPPAHHQSSLNVKLIFCWKQKKNCQNTFRCSSQRDGENYGGQRKRRVFLNPTQRVFKQVLHGAEWYFRDLHFWIQMRCDLTHLKYSKHLKRLHLYPLREILDCWTCPCTLRKRN